MASPTLLLLLILGLIVGCQEAPTQSDPLPAGTLTTASSAKRPMPRGKQIKPIDRSTPEIVMPA